MNRKSLFALFAIGVLALAGTAYASGVWMELETWTYPDGTYVQVNTSGAPGGSAAMAYWIDQNTGTASLVAFDGIDPGTGTAFLWLPAPGLHRIDVCDMSGTVLATGYVGGVDYD